MKHYKKQKGITLPELMIAAVILIIIMAAAMGVYWNTQKSWQLGEKEAQMQQQAKIAIMNMTKELRQAYDVWIVPIPSSAGCELNPNLPCYSKDMRFTIPILDSNSNLYGYKIVRYWYVMDPTTLVWSLRRFVWNGTSGTWVSDPDPRNKNLTPAIQGNAGCLKYHAGSCCPSGMAPCPPVGWLSNTTLMPGNEINQPLSVAAYEMAKANSTAILQEAAVIDPGRQSYFEQDKNTRQKLYIHLVTAVYKAKTNSTDWKQRQLERTFVLRSEVQFRNLQ